MYWQTIKIGIKNLLLHKLRSLLTMLGVILGASSVISMLAIGEGSKQEALEQIRQLGASNVIIRSVKPGQDGGGDDENSTTQQQQQNFILEYGLKYKDFERLKSTLPTITDAVSIALLKKPAFYENRWIPNTRILGTTPDYLKIKPIRLRRGRFITGPDIRNNSNVAVLGAGAALRLFRPHDPMNFFARFDGLGSAAMVLT